MKFVLYDILDDQIKIFERRSFLNLKYCMYDDNASRSYIRLHPKSYPDRFVVLGRLYGRRHLCT